MKRTRVLKNASAVGWLAEFPDELLALIIAFLPRLPQEIPNLGLILRFLAVSKRMYNILKPSILGLLKTFLAFDFCVSSHEAMGEYGLAAYAHISFIHAGEYVDRRSYIAHCMENEEKCTPDKLINCLSLLHLAYLEGYHMYRDVPLHLIDSLECVSPYESIRNYMYYNRVTKKAIPLRRMGIDQLGCNSTFAHRDSLYDQLEECLKLMDETYRIASFRKLHPFDGTTMRARTIQLLREHRNVQVHNVSPDTCFRDLIVMIDHKPYYIFEDGAKSFRDNCFMHRSGSIIDATMRCRLHINHDTNWDIVHCSDRFCHQ